jgi:hypothetical protein
VQPAFVADRPLRFGSRLVFEPQLRQRARFLVPQRFVAPCAQLNCAPRTNAAVALTPEATTIATPPPTMKRCVFVADKWTCERVPVRSVVGLDSR